MTDSLVAVVISACDCNYEGSETLQCNRRTGVCECVPGVAGDKCDYCARGTTGVLPNCEPCGECFDDWDAIISDLRGSSKQLLHTHNGCVTLCLHLL